MFVYIMSNKRRGVMYTGVTSDIVLRVYQHKNHITGGFTARYGLDRLVWFDSTDDELAAIAHENRLKRWHKEWKFALIEERNPDWIDLYPTLLG
jgi:putative endonuclease